MLGTDDMDDDVLAVVREALGEAQPPPREVAGEDPL
jgi:hypothetical protein